MEYLWRDKGNWCLDCLWRELHRQGSGWETNCYYILIWPFAYHTIWVLYLLLWFLRQTSLLLIKSSNRVTKVIRQQNYCFPWEGSDKVVIHGIIMIVSFAELSLWAGHRDNGFVHLLQALPQPQRFPHFQKEESLPQRGKVTYPKKHSWCVSGQEFTWGSCDSRFQSFWEEIC